MCRSIGYFRFLCSLRSMIWTTAYLLSRPCVENHDVLRIANRRQYLIIHFESKEDPGWEKYYFQLCFTIVVNIIECPIFDRQLISTLLPLMYDTSLFAPIYVNAIFRIIQKCNSVQNIMCLYYWCRGMTQRTLIL